MFTTLMSVILLALSAGATDLHSLPACSGLDAVASQRVQALASSQHLYDCCDGTISECLAQDPPCKLATRLADELCRRVADGQTDPAIEQSLQLRARSMMPTGAPATISLDGWPGIGDADAPVTVVAYVCLRCPFCAMLEPRLIHAMTDGPLKGKARLYVKMFPLKSHPGSSAAALAAMAAHEQGRYYDYLSLAFTEFNAFSDDRLGDWAARLGLDLQAWETSAHSETTRAALVDSKREGIAIGVDATPTLFIDGRKYVAHLDAEQIIDLVEEEYDRLSGEDR